MTKRLIFLYKLRFLFVGVLAIAGFFMLSFLIASIEIPHVQAEEANSSDEAYTISVSDDPNVVTSGMIAAADDTGKSINSAAYTFMRGSQSAARTINWHGKVIARGAQTGTVAAARGVGSGLASAGRAVGHGAAIVFHAPGNALEYIAHTSTDFVRPSDHAEVPVIDPNSPELLAALAALPPTPQAQPAAPHANAGPAWPIHGAVTTEFGVAHWPYQQTHTGLDISDARPMGVTPIRPFRPGRVVEVVQSRSGLGNHVVIDHGNGVTSVYGHLNSISVGVGQEVGMDATLGFEGSTGVSTGTHLHFEIRVNGQAANPRQFINGTP